MPFSLRNAAKSFQCFMDQVLCGVTSAYTYIDDVLIASPTPEQHLIDLRTVFEQLSSHGIVIKFKLSVTFHNLKPNTNSAGSLDS